MSDQNLDTAAATSATADTSAGDPGVATATTATGSATSAETQTAASTQAPSQPQTAADTTTQPATPGQDDWTRNVPDELQQILRDPQGAKRLAGMHKLYGQQTNEIGALRKQVQQYEGLDPQQARTALQELEKLKAQQQASPFSKRHPEFAANRERIAKADLWIKAAQGLDEAQARSMAHRMGVTTDDLKMHREAEQYSARLRQEFEADPDEFVESRLERKLEERFAQYEQMQNARASTQQWLGDPQNAAYIQNYAVELDQLMDPQVSMREKIAYVGKLMAERDALRKQVGSQVEDVAAAQAQQAALSTRAQTAARRSSAQAPRIDNAYAHVRDVLKLQPGTPEFFAKMREINASAP